MFNAGNLQRHRFHVSVGLARVDAHWLGLRMNRHMMLPLHWNMERACAISWLTSGPCGSTGMARLSRMRTRMASHPPHCDSVKIYSIQVLVGGPLRWETAATVIQAVTSTSSWYSTIMTSTQKQTNSQTKETKGEHPAGSNASVPPVESHRLFVNV